MEEIDRIEGIEAFIYAANLVFRDKSKNTDPYSSSSNPLSGLKNMIDKGETEFQAISKMAKAVRDTEYESAFLSFIISAIIKDEKISSAEKFTFLDRYKQLTSEELPSLMIKGDFSLSVLRLLMQDSARLRAYMDAYPVDVYSNRVAIQRLGIDLPSDHLGYLQENIRKNGMPYNLKRILSVEDPVLQRLLLEYGVAEERTAEEILVNIKKFSKKVPNYKEYVRASIQTLGVRTSLELLSYRLEQDYQLVLPFLNELNPHIHDGYEKDPLISDGIAFVMNALHARPAAERFSIVKGFTAAELLNVILISREHHYTSTFNGVFDIFLDRMRAEKTGWTKILDDHKKLVPSLPFFVDATVVFNRVSDLLETMTDDDKLIFIDAILPDRTKPDNSSNAMDPIAVANFIRVLQPTDSMVPMIESRLASNYINTSDESEKADIALFANWYINDQKRKPSEGNESFFQKFATDSRYRIPNILTLPTGELLDSKGRNFQMHLFYNDDDGKASYASFREALQKNGWKEENVRGFIKFSKFDNKRSIEILVSPPEADGKKATDIQEYVEAMGGKISVLVHRGHSYHVDKSLEHINEDNRLIFLGSCGGQTNVQKVLSATPNAQIIATSGTGRMAINNESFIDINQQILGGDQIDWQKMKAKWMHRAEGNSSLRQDYLNYVAPHENLPFLFLRKKIELLSEPAEAAPPLSDIRQNFERSSSYLGGISEKPDETPIRTARNDPYFSVLVNS